MVWSMDIQTGTWVPKPISGWIKKDPKSKDKWYTVSTYGPGTKNGVISNTVTSRHKFLVYRDKELQWVFTNDLKLSDRLVSHTKGSFKLHSKARSFLNGMLMGDSSIRIRKYTSANLHISDNVNLGYARWKVSKLNKIIPFREYITKKGFIYRSSYSPELKLIKDDLGNKRDPLNILIPGQVDWLTLAIWYMDDGHYHGDKRSTCCISIPYNRTDINTLQSILEDYGIPCTLTKNKKIIRFNKKSTEILHKNICKYIPEPMQYKLSSKYRGNYIDFELEPSEIDYTLYLKIISIKEASDRKLRHPYKYDLTIEDTHNFLAGNKDNGIVVHNTTPGGQALRFYASLRIGLYGGKQITKKIKGKERKIGRVTSIRTMKNKVAPPGPTLKSTPLYNNPRYVDTVGFDRLHFLDEILIEEGIVDKSSSGTFTYKGKTLCRGSEKFKTLLEDDDSLRRKLIKKANINTLGNTKKLLASLNENLYPIDNNSVDEYSEEEEDE